MPRIRIWSLIYVFFGLGIWPTGLRSQTQFLEPTGKEDLASYTYPDQCSAALKRLLNDQERELGGISWDTVPLDRVRGMDPLPDSVRSAMQLCTRRWTAQTAPLYYYNAVLKTMIAAGRDDDALQVLQRKLDTPSVQARVGALIVAAQMFSFSTPAQIRRADSLMIEAKRISSLQTKFQEWLANCDLRVRAIATGHDDYAMRAAIRAETAWVDVDPDLKNDRFSGGMWRKAEALNNWYVHRHELLDSFSVSTEAYVRAAQRHRTIIELGVERPYLGVFGKNLPRIEPGPGVNLGGAEARPTPGKLSIVWPIVNDCAMFGAGNSCHTTYAMLRRIKKRFPEVEILLLTYREGWFGGRVPPTADDEYALKKRWLIDTQHIPGTLVLLPEITIKLPQPDGRIIDLFWEQTLMNAYSDYGNANRGNKLVALYEIVVVDPMGVALWEERVSLEAEDFLNDLLAAHFRSKKTP